MLIRSQDKSRLLSLNNTRELRFWECAQGFNITDCVCPIGHYSTREKAMKVLDMIQDAYSEYQIMLNFSVSYLHEFKEKTDGFAIFQMPEDSEVEA